MSEFVDIYYQYLPEEREMSPRKNFWPSSVYNTDKDIAFQMLGIQTELLTIASKIRMEDGIMYHEYIGEAFVKYCNVPESEWTFKDGRDLGKFRKTYKKKVTISGCPDIMATHRETGEVIAIELKTSKSESLRAILKAGEPLDWHKQQVMIYLWVGGWKKGKVIYKDKNLGQMYEFDVPYDKKYMQTILDRFYSIADILDKYEGNSSEEAISYINKNFKEELKWQYKKATVRELEYEQEPFIAETALAILSNQEFIDKAKLKLGDILKEYKVDQLRVGDYLISKKTNSNKVEDKKIIKQFVEAELIPETVLISENIKVEEINEDTK